MDNTGDFYSLNMGSIPVRRTNIFTKLKNMMNSRLNEILVIAQEEAAEVIQEISKCFRFGINTEDRSGVLHRERLEQEIADFLVMVDLLEEEGVVTENGITAAKLRKVKKLQVWSKIYRS
jgi:hypothetical protein